jgi:hypothetical protein
MRQCKLIQQAAVGFDSIDHRAAAELGIPVANAAAGNWGVGGRLDTSWRWSHSFAARSGSTGS